MKPVTLVFYIQIHLWPPSWLVVFIECWLDIDIYKHLAFLKIFHIQLYYIIQVNLISSGHCVHVFRRTDLSLWWLVYISAGKKKPLPNAVFLSSRNSTLTIWLTGGASSSLSIRAVTRSSLLPGKMPKWSPGRYLRLSWLLAWSWT